MVGGWVGGFGGLGLGGLGGFGAWGAWGAWGLEAGMGVVRVGGWRVSAVSSDPCMAPAAMSKRVGSAKIQPLCPTES